MDYNKCIHCGDDCGKFPVIWEDKNFCCHGCKTVYQLLNKNNLYKYYQIESTPGIKVDNQNYGNKYAYLDNIDIQEKLYEFSEGDISKVKLFIPSIHCSSCIWLLENLHLIDKGIKNSLVNFTKKEVSVTINTKEISLRKLVEILVSVHYIPQINLSTIEGKKNEGNSRNLIFKIGLAGFAFGNIMLLSMPEYLSISEDLGVDFKDFFGYISIVLSIPVLLYSSNDYFLSAIKNLRHRIINIDLPISLGIIALFLQSIYEIISGTGSGYLDSFAGFVFFLLIGKWYQNKTYQALAFDRDYKSYFPVAVTKIFEDHEVNTPLKEIKIGDRLLIRNQELIPTDGVIVKGIGNIDYSFVTGESAPVSKNENDIVFAGGKQIGSAIQVLVKKEVSQSQLTQLWNQNNCNSEFRTIRSMIDKLSRNFTIIVLIIAFASFAFWYFYNPSMASLVFTSVLIVACPCAIALSMPFTFGTAMRIYGIEGFYLKNTDVVEKLTHINTIVFDKTGTITHTTSRDVSIENDNLCNEDKGVIKSLARQSSHPLSNAVFNFIDSDLIFDVLEYMEIPSSGIKGIVNGRMVKIGSGDFVPGELQYDKAYSTEVFASIDGVRVARFIVKNKYREGIEEVINNLKDKYELHMLSGDNDLEKEKLSSIFGSGNNLFFNQSPQDKLNYISRLKEEGRNVLMIGDGLNDAGALNTSDLGISIADDIYQFSPASDAILEAGRFYKLFRFIIFSKTSLKIVKISFIISIIYNFVGLSFAIQGLLSPIIAAILMPLSSVSVVSFVTLTTRYLGKKRFN